LSSAYSDNNCNINPKVFTNHTMTSTFGATSTAAEVASHYAANIKDKVILTTGVSPKSLGAEFVRTIAAHSPRLIILAGRNPTKLQATADVIREAHPNVPVRLLTLDLSSQQQVRQAAKEVLAYDEKIDVLVNNAGIMAQPYATTVDGLEAQFGTNHIGHFLFTNKIFPQLAPDARVVNICSGGHRLSPIRFDDLNFSNGATYNPWIAYGQSKTANMLFSVGLAHRHGPRLKSYSLHPGAIPTNLTSHLVGETRFDGMIQLDRELGNFESKRAGFEWKDLQQGTATHVFAAFGDDIEPNGAYLVDCQVARPELVRSGAGNVENAIRLWRVSEDIVGEKFE
jgi:NAD(P)-dependent dehydrogenase (short-subunit alcohol dehydrogenase family)